MEDEANDRVVAAAGGDQKVVLANAAETVNHLEVHPEAAKGTVKEEELSVRKAGAEIVATDNVIDQKLTNVVDVIDPRAEIDAAGIYQHPVAPRMTNHQKNAESVKENVMSKGDADPEAVNEITAVGNLVHQAVAAIVAVYQYTNVVVQQVQTDFVLPAVHVYPKVERVKSQHKPTIMMMMNSCVFQLILSTQKCSQSIATHFQMYFRISQIMHSLIR